MRPFGQPQKEVRRQKLRRDLRVDLACEFCWSSDAEFFREIGYVSGSEFIGQH